MKSKTFFLILFGLICATANANAESSFTCSVLDSTSVHTNLSSTESTVMKTLVFPEDGYASFPIDLSDTSMVLHRVKISLSGVMEGYRSLTISWEQPSGAEVSVGADVKTGKVATGSVQIDQHPIKISCIPTRTVPVEIQDLWKRYWKSKKN